MATMFLRFGSLLHARILSDQSTIPTNGEKNIPGLQIEIEISESNSHQLPQRSVADDPIDLLRCNPFKEASHLIAGSKY